jgi:hypothetical protein
VPGSWWCKHRDSRGADLENEAMATRQTSQRAKTKAEAKADTDGTNKPKAKSEREPERRNARALSRSAVARTDRAGETATAAAAPKTSLNGSEMVHEKLQQARLSSKPVAAPADVATASASGGEQPPASTKRAQLIGMLERAEGASVAEIGQRFGWLPHTVRAVITGLRKAGREITRSKDADDRSVYRLAPVKSAGER